MEFIKKTILQIITTGTTATTSGDKHIIIPDTGVTYYMKICLESTVNDIGFFDAYDPEIVVMPDDDNDDTTTTTTTTTTTLPTTLPLIEYCYNAYYPCGDPLHEISGYEPYTGSITYWDEYGIQYTIYCCADDNPYIVYSSSVPITYAVNVCV